MFLKCLLFTSIISQLRFIGGGHSISKRYLLFTRSTVLQFSTGLTVPLVLTRRSINFSFVAQANYNAPYNITTLQPKIVRARDKEKPFPFFDITRKSFYKYIIRIFDSLGLDGEQCLYRSICEIAEFPMYIKEDETLLEKIVNFIFTPSLEFVPSFRNITNVSRLNLEDQLLVAEKHGITHGDCSVEYRDCIVSVVDLFTNKFFI